VLSSIGDGPYTKRQRRKGVVMQAWIMLAAAGLFEIVWAIGLKYSEGFTKTVPSTITLIAMLISMWLLAQAARELPIGTAYAVWTGIGAVGAALLGMMLFHESANVMRLGCIALIVVGIVGLKFSTPA
jgi:quaternary ammonium compound-resistance protein SugE